MVVEFSHCGWEKKKWDGKKKSCYILGDVYRSGFAFKTQRKKNNNLFVLVSSSFNIFSKF